VHTQPAAQLGYAKLAGVRDQLERLECPGHGLQSGPSIVCHRATLAGGRNTGERAATHAGERYWRAADPRPAYEVVIVGGGGHGLATAHYLAKNHGITDVAVLERGWLGGGNVARNTTIIRSNYLLDESAAIYEHSLKLWEGLEEDLQADLQFSQRGVLNLAHDLGDVRSSVRRVEANRLNGVDAEWLEPGEVKAFCPIVNVSPDVRYPVLGATLQRRGGIARHDKMAWGFANAADRRGVDIVENCEVTGFLRGDAGRVTGVTTTRGDIHANTVALVAAGHTSVLASMVRLRLPLQSHPLQALVSVLLEPVLSCVVMSNAVHVYVSQADKGELVMGAGIDALNSYTQRGSFHVIERQMAAALELFPIFAQAKVLRTWAGIVDVCPDASPIIGRTPIDGLYLNCGWGTGGFKATPGSGWVFADTIANERPHPLAEPYALERFVTGALIDEHGAAAVAH
jgi:sarcosine oxidase subunit beta